MAEIRTTVPSRAQLSQFASSLEAIKFFENLALDVSQTLPGMTEDASQVVLSSHLGVFGRRIEQPAQQREPNDAPTILAHQVFGP